MSPLTEKTIAFGKRQASRREQEKNTRTTTAIRHLLGLRRTPEMNDLSAWGAFERQPSRATLLPVLEQFHRRSGRHFNVQDMACILSQQTCHRQVAEWIRILDQKLQTRRSGQRHLVYQSSEDPTWRKMTAYIRTIDRNQKEKQIWIRHYTNIGQAINTYMKTRQMSDVRDTINSFYHEDPWLVGNYYRMNDRGLEKVITDTISGLDDLFRSPDNHLPDNVIVFRAVRRPFSPELQMNTWLEIDHYISTSRTPGILDRFIHTHLPNPDYPDDEWKRIGGTVFRILIPEGTPIINIAGREKEVLLPPGKLFLYRHIPGGERYAHTGKVSVVDAIYEQSKG